MVIARVEARARARAHTHTDTESDSERDSGQQVGRGTLRQRQRDINIQWFPFILQQSSVRITIRYSECLVTDCVCVCVCVRLVK